MLADKTIVVVCCVCWRAWMGESPIDTDFGRWSALDDLLTNEGLGPDDYVLSHGYCQECLGALLQEFHARQTPSDRAALPR